MKEDLKKGIITILGYNKEGKGTGFFVEQSKIITCAHVVIDLSEKFQYRDYTGNIYDAEVINIDEKSDVALCKSKKLSEYVLVLKDKQDLSEEEIYEIYGFLGKDAISVSTRNVVFNNYDKNHHKWILDNANNIFEGSSGSPLINTNDEVVGMIAQIIDTHCDRAINLCTAIRGREVSQILISSDIAQKDRFTEIIERFPRNKYNYSRLVRELKKDGFVCCYGDSLSDFTLGKKSEFINYVCDNIINELMEFYPDVRTTVLNGELWFALEDFPDEFIHGELIREIQKRTANIYFDNAKIEFHVAAYILYFDTFLRFFSDRLVEELVALDKGVMIPVFPDTELTSKVNNARYTYTMSGDVFSDNPQLYLYNDYSNELLQHLKCWIDNRSILFVDVNFKEKEIGLLEKLNSRKSNCAIVTCNCSVDEQNTLYETLTRANVYPILVNEFDKNAVYEIMHKLMVDTGNCKFENMYDFLDFRYSRHPLIGRSNELEWLTKFLNTDMKFSWTKIYGEIGCGKSRLVHDFVCENKEDWDCYFIHCEGIENFLESNTCANIVSSKILLVFDDFYLNNNQSVQMEKIIKLYVNPKNITRIIFVCRDNSNLFKDIDEAYGKIVKRGCYKEPPLEIKHLDLESVICACKGYAIYLKTRSGKVNDSFETILARIPDEITQLFEKHANDPLLLYLCLAKILELLGLLPPGWIYVDQTIKHLNSICGFDGHERMSLQKYGKIISDNDNYKEISRNVKNSRITYNQIEELIHQDDRGMF